MLSPRSLAAALGLPPPTDEQAAVIAAPARSALVVAGAGAGKTETMAARVVWLVATGQVLPEQVLGLTFTRKAAQQLGVRVRTRLRRLAGSRLLDDLDPTGARRAAVLAGEPTVATYHAYAGRLVGEHALRLPAEPGARLLGSTGAWQLAHRVVTTWADDLDVDRVPATVTGYVLALAGELGEHLVEPAAVRAHAAALAALLDRAPPGPRQKAEPSQRYRRWSDAQRMRHALIPLVEAFGARKRAERALDFGDQLAIAARVAAEHPEVGTQERATYRAVLLDEYQDTGHAQRVLLRALFGAAPEPRPVAHSGGHRRRRPVPVDLRLARRERGQPPAVPHRLPGSGRRSRRRVRPAHELPQPARRCSHWRTPCPRRSARLPCGRRGRADGRAGRRSRRRPGRAAAGCRGGARLAGRRDRRVLAGGGGRRGGVTHVGRPRAPPGRHGRRRRRAAGA